MRKDTFKFMLIYNAIVFTVYFLISTVLFFYTGSTAWTLSFQTVPVWVFTFLLSFLIAYASRKHLGFGIFIVTTMVVITFVIYFIYQTDVLNDFSTEYLYFFHNF